MQRIWAAQLALFMTGTCGLLIFPFLTYVPSDGMLGDMLPKVILLLGIKCGGNHSSGLCTIYSGYRRSLRNLVGGINLRPDIWLIYMCHVTVAIHVSYQTLGSLLRQYHAKHCNFHPKDRVSLEL